jgi:hypothetical protein
MKRWMVLLILAGLPGLLWAQQPVPATLEPLVNKAGSGTLFTFEIQAPVPVPGNAVFELTFPAGFDLSRVTLAGSSVMKGGFRVDVAGQTVRIRRTGEGPAVAAGRRIDLKFSLVKNPPAGGTYTVRWAVRNRAGNTIAGPGEVQVNIAP